MGEGQKRNLPCTCGSGKKYKRCCAIPDRSIHTTPPPSLREMQLVKNSPAERYLRLVPSVVNNGRRCRAVFNKICLRPEKETFHEFLAKVVAWTLGGQWMRSQMSTPKAGRHPVGAWMQDFSDYRAAPRDYRREVIGGRDVHSAIAPSSVSNLLQLGYDFFCLQAIDRLPDHLVRRIKKSRTFPAARYEIAVSAIMARSGFAIDYIEDSGSQEKRCEFIAAHRTGGYKIGVEAKCRLRDPHVDPASYSYDEDYKGIANLVRKAKNQAPPGMPFVIFIDVNLPPSAGYSPRERPWLPNIARALDTFGPRSAANPDPFSMLVATNYGHLFGAIDDFDGRGEWGAMVPEFPMVPLPDRYIAQTIWDTVGRYANIPREV